MEVSLQLQALLLLPLADWIELDLGLLPRGLCVRQVVWLQAGKRLECFGVVLESLRPASADSAVGSFPRIPPPRRVPYPGPELVRWAELSLALR